MAERDSVGHLPETMGAIEETIARNDRLAEVFRTYNETLVAYLASRLRSRHRALEVAQEAYVRLLNAPNLDQVIDLKSFLFMTANRISIDWNRRDRTQERVLRQAGALAEFGSTASVPTPEIETSAGETLQLLRAAIEELSPKCRMAFVLYKLQGESYESIARRMDLTESMVRKYVLRGLQYCRQRLDWPHASARGDSLREG